MFKTATIRIAFAATFLLTGAHAVYAEDVPADSGEKLMPTGPLVGPLTKEETGKATVVPEPVLTSMLAAVAVILLRSRARR